MVVFAAMPNVCTILFVVSYVPHFSTVGCVLTLGEGDTGQLGLGPDVLERAKPAKVNVPNMVQVCAGGMHTVCLTKNGEVSTCLYFDHNTILLLLFFKFYTLRKATNHFHSPFAMITLLFRQVYTFGCNDEGGLGRATEEESEPGKVDLPAKIVQVSAGDSHTAALSEEGKIYIWGTFRVSLYFHSSKTFLCQQSYSSNCPMAEVILSN